MTVECRRDIWKKEKYSGKVYHASPWWETVLIFWEAKTHCVLKNSIMMMMMNKIGGQSFIPSDKKRKSYRWKNFTDKRLIKVELCFTCALVFVRWSRLELLVAGRDKGHDLADFLMLTQKAGFFWLARGAWDVGNTAAVGIMFICRAVSRALIR